MLNNVFRKTLYEKRWMTLAWAAGFFAMTILTMSFYPYFKNAGFGDLFANAPKSIQNIIGAAADYKTVTGYVDQQIFAMRMPMLTIIMSISLFFSIGVGDEDRGILETLLAQTVSRSKVYWQKFLAGALLLGLAHLAIIAGVMASYPIVHGSVAFDRLLMATFACWLLSLVFGTIAYMAGAITGKRGLTIGTASGLAFGSYLISSLAPAVDKLASAVKFTPFYYYNTPAVGQHGLKLTNVLVLVISIFVLCVAGLLVFRRRDLVRD
ncbi:MAG: ABC transporter permease subunit [Candidatus Saccharibacteria bacterium]